MTETCPVIHFEFNDVDASSLVAFVGTSTTHVKAVFGKFVFREW